MKNNFLGKEVNPGDLVVYSRKHSGKYDQPLRLGVVTKITPTGATVLGCQFTLYNDGFILPLEERGVLAEGMFPISTSDLSVSELAKRYNVNAKIAANWVKGVIDLVNHHRG